MFSSLIEAGFPPLRLLWVNNVPNMQGVCLKTNSARSSASSWCGRTDLPSCAPKMRPVVGSNLNVSLLSSSGDGHAASSNSSSSSAAAVTPGASSAGPVVPTSLAPDAAADAALNRSDPSPSPAVAVAAGNSSVTGNFITALSPVRGV